MGVIVFFSFQNKEITVKFMFYNEDVILECVTFNMTFKSIVPAATEEPDSAGSIVPSGTLVFLLCLSYPMIKYFLWNVRSIGSCCHTLELFFCFNNWKKLLKKWIDSFSSLICFFFSIWRFLKCGKYYQPAYSAGSSAIRQRWGYRKLFLINSGWLQTLRQRQQKLLLRHLVRPLTSTRQIKEKRQGQNIIALLSALSANFTLSDRGAREVS